MNDEIDQIGDKTQSSYLARARAAAAKLKNQYSKTQKTEGLESKIAASKNYSGRKSISDAKGGLAVGVGRDIYLFVPGSVPVKIAERSSWVKSLCASNGILYDGGDYKKIISSEDGTIAERDHFVEALCFFDGGLLDADAGGTMRRTRRNHIIRQKSSSINALCVYNQELYYGCNTGFIYRKGDRHHIAQRRDWISALCVYDGELLDVGGYNQIYQTLHNRDLLPSKCSMKSCLAIHDGVLYAGDLYGVITQPIENEKVYEFKGKWVTAMCSIDEELYQKLLPLEEEFK